MRDLETRLLSMESDIEQQVLQRVKAKEVPCSSWLLLHVYSIY